MGCFIKVWCAQGIWAICGAGVSRSHAYKTGAMQESMCAPARIPATDIHAIANAFSGISMLLKYHKQGISSG